MSTCVAAITHRYVKFYTVLNTTAPHATLKNSKPHTWYKYMRICFREKVITST